jgi:4-amino-4-deoxy-L-arabinose transferase-like glycosyltransferase
MIPLMVVLCVIAAGWLMSALVARRIGVRAPRILLPALGVGVLAVMLAPTVWAAIPVIQYDPAQANNPLAGPSQRDGFGGNFGGGRDENGSADPALVRYLEANQGNATFLVATPSSMTADGIILATNKPVMAMGGFSGSDPILTTSKLASLVANGTVRFFLLNARRQLPQQVLNQIPQQFRNRLQQGGFPFGGGQQAALTTWVTQHCTPVPAKLWQSASTSSSSGSGFGPFGANQLYDCAPTH